MSKKQTNPYKRGNYQLIMAVVMGMIGKAFTRSQIVDATAQMSDSKGKSLTDSAVQASVTVVLSPRESSTRGDCRGNFSAQGHLYFVKPLAKKDGEEQKFQLRWRLVAMEVRKYTPKTVKQTKTKTKTKAKRKTAAKAAVAK